VETSKIFDRQRHIHNKGYARKEMFPDILLLGVKDHDNFVQIFIPRWNQGELICQTMRFDSD
jgi:hypothetical protein